MTLNSGEKSAAGNLPQPQRQSGNHVADRSVAEMGDYSGEASVALRRAVRRIPKD